MQYSIINYICGYYFLLVLLSLILVHGSMKSWNFIKRIFLRDEISPRINPYLAHVVLPVSLILPWITVLLPCHPQQHIDCITYGTQTHDMHLLSNKNGNRESNSPFITLLLVVLAVVHLAVVHLAVVPHWYANNNEMKIISLLKFLWVSINQEIFLTQTFCKRNIFQWKFSRLR